MPRIISLKFRCKINIFGHSPNITRAHLTIAYSNCCKINDVKCYNRHKSAILFNNWAVLIFSAFIELVRELVIINSLTNLSRMHEQILKLPPPQTFIAKEHYFKQLKTSLIFTAIYLFRKIGNHLGPIS